MGPKARRTVKRHIVARHPANAAKPKRVTLAMLEASAIRSIGDDVRVSVYPRTDGYEVTVEISNRYPNPSTWHPRRYVAMRMALAALEAL